MTNEIIYGIWNLVVLLILFILVKFMTKGNKKVDTRGRYDFLHSLIAIVAFLMIGVLATYVFHPRPLFPTPHVTMVALIIFYVFLFEKRDFKSLGISIQNMGESVTVGLAIGIILFLNVAIINIMYVRGSGIADSFVYFVNNFDLTFVGLTHYVLIGFSEEIIFRGFLQRRFLESMKPIYAIVLVAFLFSFVHLLGSSITLEIIFLAFQRMPVSLLFGYIMYRTDNIFSVGILHTICGLPKLIGGL